MKVLYNLKSAAVIWLHFNGIGFGIGMGIGNRLQGYSDSNSTKVSMDWKYQGAHVILFSNGAITWQSWKQHLIAMSSLEAPFIACWEASREASKLVVQSLKDIHDKALPLVLATVPFSDRFCCRGSMKTRTWPVWSGFVTNGSLN
jgi:hypothetical protein